MLNQINAFFNEHSANIINIVYNGGLALFILIASKILSKISRRAITEGNHRIKKIDETLIPILCSMITYLIYIVAAVLILDIFSVNTTSIIALLGAAGIAVGFALKDTLSNVAAGMMLLFLRPFRAEDYIEFGSISGTVKEINLFNTILETFNGLFVSSPNSQIWANSIINYTRNNKRRIDIVVGISYDDDINNGLKVLQQIIEQEPRLLKEPAAQTLVLSMGESSIDLQLRAWAPTKEYWNLLWDLNKRVKEDIEKAGLTIPYPHRSLDITHQNIVSNSASDT